MSIYFEAQTGVIRRKPSLHTNFKEYMLPDDLEPILKQAVTDATIGAGGLEYEPSFLTGLDKLEAKYIRESYRKYMNL